MTKNFIVRIRQGGERLPSSFISILARNLKEAQAYFRKHHAAIFDNQEISYTAEIVEVNIL